MNLSGILTAVEEIKTQIAKDYGEPVSQEELLNVLLGLLAESRTKELKRKFVAFGPEYIAGAIKQIRDGNKESREPVGASVITPPSGGPKLIKAASRASKSL
jgi:hypothetical protein